VCGQGFDEDAFGQSFADAEPGIADLADDAGMTAEQFDLAIFAQAHFPEAGADFRRGGELFDANDAAGLDPAERANERAGALAFQNHACWTLFAHGGPQ